MLVGNKTDLCPDAALRVVKPDMGAALAGDCCGFYQECSALGDVGVSTAIELMAELLLQREDVALERALTLVPRLGATKTLLQKVTDRSGAHKTGAGWSGCDFVKVKHDCVVCICGVRCVRKCCTVGGDCLYSR